MIVYIIFIVMLLGFKFVKLEQRQGLKILMSYLLFLLIFRDWNLGLFDTLNYREYFYLFQAEGFSYVFSNRLFDSEVIMSLYMWSLAHIFRHFGGFIIVTASIYILSVYYFIKRWSVDYYFSCLLFFSVYYFFGFYLLKQTISMSVLLFAYTAFKDKKYKTFVMLLVLSIGIHKYSWVVLLLIPFSMVIKYIKQKMLIFISIVSIGIFFSERIVYAVIRFDPTHLLGKYMKLNIYNGNAARINFGMCIYIFWAILMIGYKSYVSRNDEEDFDIDMSFLSISILAAIFSSYSMIIQEFYRVAAFMGITNCVIGANIAEWTTTKKRSIYKAARIFVVLVFVFYSFKTASNTNCLDYHFYSSGNEFKFLL